MKYPECSGAGKKWITLGTGRGAGVVCPGCHRSFTRIGGTDQNKPVPPHSSVNF